METKRVILARFVEFDLPQQTCYHGNWMSDFQRNSLFVEKFLENSFFAIVCLNFTFSIIFLVNNGHRATKVHVNKVQYRRSDA